MNDLNNKPEYNSKYVSSVFHTREEADQAYRDLEARGYKADDVNILMSDKTRDTHFGEGTPDSDLDDSVSNNAGKGSLIGGGIGALVGAIAAIGSNVIFPGLGLVVAGPLAAGLAGAGTGALAGGLIGALTGAGEDEERAKIYKDEIENGGIYMGFEPKNDEDGRFIYDRWYSKKA